MPFVATMRARRRPSDHYHQITMTVPRLVSIDVFYLLRNGRPVAFALSESALRDQVDVGRSCFEITSETQLAGVVAGEVFDWSKRGGHAFNPKLHWTCPQCGQKWWEDFIGDVENPYLAGSGCRCVAYWLVHWDPLEAADEVASASNGARDASRPEH